VPISTFCNVVGIRRGKHVGGEEQYSLFSRLRELIGNRRPQSHSCHTSNTEPCDFRVRILYRASSLKHEAEAIVSIAYSVEQLIKQLGWVGLNNEPAKLLS
jgi:hypothetical protein